MAQFNVTRLLDTSKALTTQAGQQLSDVLDYLTNFVEETVKNMRSGLTFKDNFAGAVKTVSLTHGQSQKVGASQSVSAIIATRVGDPAWLLDAFGWWYDSNGNLQVEAKFTRADTTKTDLPTKALDVDLVILY